MKKFFFTLLLFAGVSICAYGQIYRHYWLNDLGKNYTLNKRIMGNTPMNYGYVLAATTQDIGGSMCNGRVTKSGIVIMKLSNNYTIEQSRIFKTANDPSAYNYDFEVYDIYPDNENYYICGKVSDFSTGAIMGFVGIVDTNLGNLTLHKYPTVEKFVSIYVESGVYFVCGKSGNGGILVRNSSGIYSVVNTDYPLYKIRAKNTGNEINVVGGDASTVIYLNALSSLSSCSKGTFQTTNNESISITNYPGQRQGLIISTSYQDSVFLYLFQDVTNCNLAYYFTEPSGYDIFVKDINCSNSKIAITGLYDDLANQHAFFFRSNIMPTIGILSAPIYMRFSPAYSSVFSNKLYKNFFDYNDSLFRCGGFCEYNNNATTFVGTPELLYGETDCVQTPVVNLYSKNTVQVTIEDVFMDDYIPCNEQTTVGWDSEYIINNDCEGIILFNKSMNFKK